MMDDETLRGALRSLSEASGAEHHLDLVELESRMRRARRRAAVTVGAASLAVVAVVTGGAVVLGSPDEPRLLRPAAVPFAGADVRERAREVYTSFAGTERQRNAGGILKAYGQNGAMDQCMDDNGFPAWDRSASRAYAHEVDPLMYGTWFAAPNRPFLSEPLMAHRQTVLAEEEMNRDEIPPDEDVAIGECIPIAADQRSPERGVETTAWSATSRDLVDAWADMVQEHSDKAADSSIYLRCMDEAAIPILDDNGIPASEMWEGLSMLGPSNGKVPSSAADPLVASAEWQDFLAEERVITDADWACRDDVYTAHIDGLLPAIDQFEADHRQEIAHAQKEWVGIEAEAKELGYTGQVGPLGR